MATGNPRIATAAALELEHVLLEDALRLVLVYLGARDRRYERSALRFHGRLCAEIPTLSLAAGAAALAAMARLSAEPTPAAEALAEILDVHSAGALVRILDEWTPGGARPPAAGRGA